jgi:CRISPR-associated protein Cas5d
LEKGNKVNFKVTGRYALFCDPLSKLGGEKFSYQIPTYQALKGVLESVYWKPTIIWYIDKIRVMKPIRTQTQSMRPVQFGGIYPFMKNSGKNEEPFNTLSIYTYLSDVEYQVQAHFEWNNNRPDMKEDQNENKHFYIAQRMIKCGGRRDIFLGTRECQGYVEPCKFGEGEGFYDNYGDLTFGLMFHGFDYPDETGENELWSRLWYPTMKDGVIKFKKPKECSIKRKIKNMKSNEIISNGVDEEGLLDGYLEWVEFEGGEDCELDAKTL